MSEPSPHSLNVAIAGAGLLGRLLAWRLLREGHGVTLFEASPFDSPRSAAHTAAAMISPLSEVVISERLIYDLGMASLQVWPRWLAELNANEQTPVSYSAGGSLVVAHPQDEAELRQFKQDLGYKLGPQDPSRWLDRHELLEREPQLDHFPRGLYLPEEAHLDNRTLLAVLLARVRELHGRCLDRTPVEIRDGSLFSGDKAMDDRFDAIIDCRGMGASAEGDLRGVRGEVMWVETREVQFRHAIRLMHPRYKLYVVPKPGDRYIIGATEIESDDRSPISLQSTLELASALYTLHPAFAEARVIETDTNLRPAYRDNMPRITRTGKCISINGLYRHGYLLAPVLVEHLSDYLTFQRRGPFWSALLRESDQSAGRQVANQGVPHG